MGAQRKAWGGRWTAVNSLWTYVNRLLHVVGISAIDQEELALLSGPLIRLRSVRHNLVLAQHPDVLHPDEPFGWISSSLAPSSASLFFLHIDTSNPSRQDRCRLATARSPRAWVTVDHKTGVLGLSVSESAAAIFEMRTVSSGKGAELCLGCVCTAGRYLSVHGDTKRARVCANGVNGGETFVMNHLPMAPSLEMMRDMPVGDCTMNEAVNRARVSNVRIQSRRFGWFVTSKPGILGGGGGKDVGWDGFVLEFDSATSTARVKDSRGVWLGFTRGLDGVVGVGEEMSGGERFRVEIVGEEDDRVVLKSRKGFLSAKRGGKMALSQQTVPGKREEFYLRVALPSIMDESQPRLRLKVCAGGARQVEAAVLVPASADVAFGVLCDYDGFKDFISDASESKVLERTSETTLSVKMVQCHSFLMLTIPMTMELDVIENPEEHIVTMDLKRGLGVKKYKGVWQAVEKPDGRCQIRCSLLASTSVPAPGFLMDGLMSHATRSTMEQLRTECIRRSTVELVDAPRGKKKTALLGAELPGKPRGSMVA
eukprot:GFKZ01006592.1.p1 GENE.GFKZ01006592.1~~GFKZ01006592.1.p1  ORF type:complete len:540 (-),score=65.53 GFKZ01006592.1:304-1923(-)